MVIELDKTFVNLVYSSEKSPPSISQLEQSVSDRKKENSYERISSMIVQLISFEFLDEMRFYYCLQLVFFMKIYESVRRSKIPFSSKFFHSFLSLIIHTPTH